MWGHIIEALCLYRIPKGSERRAAAINNAGVTSRERPAAIIRSLMTTNSRQGVEMQNVAVQPAQETTHLNQLDNLLDRLDRVTDSLYSTSAGLSGVVRDPQPCDPSTAPGYSYEGELGARMVRIARALDRLDECSVSLSYVRDRLSAK